VLGRQRRSLCGWRVQARRRTSVSCASSSSCVAAVTPTSAKSRRRLSTGSWSNGHPAVYRGQQSRQRRRHDVYRGGACRWVGSAGFSPFTEAVVETLGLRPGRAPRMDHHRPPLARIQGVSCPSRRTAPPSSVPQHRQPRRGLQRGAAQRTWSGQGDSTARRWRTRIRSASPAHLRTGAWRCTQSSSQFTRTSSSTAYGRRRLVPLSVSYVTASRTFVSRRGQLHVRESVTPPTQVARTSSRQRCQAARGRQLRSGCPMERGRPSTTSRCPCPVLGWCIAVVDTTTPAAQRGFSPKRCRWHVDSRHCPHRPAVRSLSGCRVSDRRGTGGRNTSARRGNPSSRRCRAEFCTAWSCRFLPMRGMESLASGRCSALHHASQSARTPTQTGLRAAVDRHHLRGRGVPTVSATRLMCKIPA